MCLPGSGTEKPPGLGLGTGGRRDAGWPPLCAQGWLGVGRFGVICMCTRMCAMHELCVCSHCMGGWAVCVCVCVYKHICRLVGCLLAGPNESLRGLLWPESWADSYLTLSTWDPAGCPLGGSSGDEETAGLSWWWSFSAVLCSHHPPSFCLQPSSVPSRLYHFCPFPREKG